MFADDTSTFLSGKDLNVIEKTYNEELLKVAKWLIANKLSLNVAKSNVIVFRPSKLKLTSKINIKINGELIVEKEYVKYLGLLIDNKLQWKQQIAHVKSKLQRGIGLLNRLKIYATKEVLSAAFHSFITPFVDYGLINWGTASSFSLNPIRKCVVKAINKVLPKSVSNKTFLTFDDICTGNIGKFMWKLHHEELPACIQKMFIYNKDKRTTRIQSKFMLEIPVTNYKRRFVNFNGLKTWHQIPDHIKSCNSIHSFKSKYKHALLEKY